MKCQNCGSTDVVAMFGNGFECHNCDRVWLPANECEPTSPKNEAPKNDLPVSATAHIRDAIESLKKARSLLDIKIESLEALL